MTKWMKSLFQNDKFLFIFSFFVAVVLWMLVVSDRNPQIDSVLRSVPISYVNTESFVNSGLEIISSSTNTANVKIEGRLSEVYRVSGKDIVLSADFSGIYSPGTYEVPIAVTAHPSSVSVETVDPEIMKVQIDYIVKNKREVEILYQGELPEGYELSEAKLSTTSVTIEGPENKLASISKAVAVVDLDNLTESKTFDCPLKLMSIDGSEVSHDNLKLSSTEVSVEQKVLMVKELPVQVILSGEASFDAAVVCDPANVIVKGEKDILEKISQIETEPIPAERVPEGNGRITIKLDVPEGVECETENIIAVFKIN